MKVKTVVKVVSCIVVGGVALFFVRQNTFAVALAAIGVAAFYVADKYL